MNEYEISEGELSSVLGNIAKNGQIPPKYEKYLESAQCIPFLWKAIEVFKQRDYQFILLSIMNNAVVKSCPDSSLIDFLIKKSDEFASKVDNHALSIKLYKFQAYCLLTDLALTQKSLTDLFVKYHPILVDSVYRLLYEVSFFWTSVQNNSKYSVVIGKFNKEMPFITEEVVRKVLASEVQEIDLVVIKFLMTEFSNFHLVKNESVILKLYQSSFNKRDLLPIYSSIFQVVFESYVATDQTFTVHLKNIPIMLQYLELKINQYMASGPEKVWNEYDEIETISSCCDLLFAFIETGISVICCKMTEKPIEKIEIETFVNVIIQFIKLITIRVAYPVEEDISQLIINLWTHLEDFFRHGFTEIMSQFSELYLEIYFIKTKYSLCLEKFNLEWDCSDQEKWFNYRSEWTLWFVDNYKYLKDFHQNHESNLYNSLEDLIKFSDTFLSQEKMLNMEHGLYLLGGCAKAISEDVENCVVEQNIAISDSFDQRLTRLVNLNMLICAKITQTLDNMFQSNQVSYPCQLLKCFIEFSNSLIQLIGHVRKLKGSFSLFDECIEKYAQLMLNFYDSESLFNSHANIKFGIIKKACLESRECFDMIRIDHDNYEPILNQCMRKLCQPNSMTTCQSIIIYFFLTGRCLPFVKEETAAVQLREFLQNFWIESHQESQESHQNFNLGIKATSQFFEGVSVGNNTDLPSWLCDLQNFYLENLFIGLSSMTNLKFLNEFDLQGEIKKIIELAWQSNSYPQNEKIMFSILNLLKVMKNISSTFIINCLVWCQVPFSTLKLPQDFEKKTEFYDGLILTLISELNSIFMKILLEPSISHCKTSRIFVTRHYQVADSFSFFSLLQYIQEVIRYSFCRKKKIIPQLSDATLQCFFSIIYSGCMFLNYIQVTRLAQNTIRKFLSLLDERKVPLINLDLILINSCIFESILENHLSIKEAASIFSILIKSTTINTLQVEAIRYLLGQIDFSEVTDENSLKVRNFLTSSIKLQDRTKLAGTLLSFNSKLNLIRDVLSYLFS